MHTIIKLVQATGAVLQFASIVCAVVATAVNLWYTAQYIDLESEKGASLHMGLWKKCRQIGDNRPECMSWNTLEKLDKFDIHWAQVCQALMIVGVVLNVHFLVISAVIRSTSLQKDNVVMKIVSFFCAGPFLMTVAVYAASYKQCLHGNQKRGEFGEGFHLAIAATIMTSIGARMYMLQEHRDRESLPLLTKQSKDNIA